MTSYCPSHDWDRHCDELDAAAEAKIAFCKNYRAEILQAACAILSSPQLANVSDTAIVDRAENIVMEVIARGEQDDP